MTIDLIPGRYVPERTDQLLWLKPGEYGRDARSGVWYARPPGISEETFIVANLNHHVITTHEDGTITVSPSIEVRAHDLRGEPVCWHGYLEQGNWRIAV